MFPFSLFPMTIPYNRLYLNPLKPAGCHFSMNNGDYLFSDIFYLRRTMLYIFSSHATQQIFLKTFQTKIEM